MSNTEISVCKRITIDNLGTRRLRSYHWLTAPRVKGGWCVRLTTLPPSCAVVMKSGNLNFLKASGPLQVYNGTALPFLHPYIPAFNPPVLSHVHKMSPFFIMSLSNTQHAYRNCNIQLIYHICVIPLGHSLNSSLIQSI